MANLIIKPAVHLMILNCRMVLVLILYTLVQTMFSMEKVFRRLKVHLQTVQMHLQLILQLETF